MAKIKAKGKNLFSQSSLITFETIPSHQELSTEMQHQLGWGTTSSGNCTVLQLKDFHHAHTSTNAHTHTHTCTYAPTTHTHVHTRTYRHTHTCTHIEINDLPLSFTPSLFLPPLSPLPLFSLSLSLSLSPSQTWGTVM